MFKKPVHELFEAQASRTPRSIAVAFGEEQITYEQLNARANQVAYQLGQFGVARGALVGICMERAPEMVVAVLAVLKAGAAYVPLDPAYPQDRLAFMLNDAKVAALLTHQPAIGRVPRYEGQQVCLDTDWSLMETNPTANPHANAGPDDLAYVIYTSGSTGTPKGAMIRHRGLTNYLGWACEEYRVAEGCGALLHSSISFDLTVTSLFTPLLTGRTLFLVSDGIENLATALLARENYSLVKITPAHLRALAELLPPEQVSGSVRALVIGGEALHFEDVEFWRKHAPATRLINEYGPTETVVGCCVYEIAADDPAIGNVPIGRAIAHTQLHILDEDLNAVATGQPGELYIGGEGVAAGYLNRPDLTAQRFISQPFHDNGETRLYRSGDLARTLPDGNLEYLGRVDDQIKINGYRIEPGEIEVVLKQHPEVTDCAVVVCDHVSGEKRLTAFVVTHGSAGADGDLKKFLGQKVPEYMVPASFVKLDRLPLTTNGKIDRKGLAAQALSANASVCFVPPRSSTEETLAQIWAEVLKQERISVTDNFFDLGGDSILGTLILARASRAGLKISPLQLFQHQTIAELSTAIQ